MKISKKSILSASLAVTLAAATLIGGGTYAYLHDSTDDVVNNFNTNKVMVELTEESGQKYNVIPGTSETKNPIVTVDNTVDAYVFVEVTDTTAGLVDYAIEDGWLPLDGVANVYYREVKADAAEKEFHVLKGDKVSYSPELDNEDMLSDYGTKLQGVNLSFKASAIQMQEFDGALNAYFQNDTEDGIIRVSDSAGLINAIKNAEEGDIILVAEGIYAPAANYEWDIKADNVTLIGAGAGKTVLNAGEFNVSGQAGFYVHGSNVTVKDMTIKTESADKNVCALKVSSNDGASYVENFTLENVDIKSNKGHGFNLHGVTGAVINNVTVSEMGRVGLALAESTGIKLTNTTFAKDGSYTPNGDICMMWKSTYRRASELTIGEGCNFGKGKIYAENKAGVENVNTENSGYEWTVSTVFWPLWTIVK